MKKIVLLLTILVSTTISAQIKVKINDKLITETTVIKAEEIQKMEVAFDKPKKLSYYGSGRLFVWVELLNDKDERFEEYYFTKDGSNSIETFLDDVNTFFALPSPSTKQTPFYGTRIRSSDDITAKFEFAGQYRDAKVVKFRISVSFRDKIGYEKYGDVVYLVKPQIFTVDNTFYFDKGQKQKEIDKAAEETKKAEQAKADEEAKKQAEAKEKAGTGKKLLRKIGF